MVQFVEKMYANVVSVISCLYRAMSLTLVREQRFIRINFSMKRGLIPNIRMLCYVIIIR